MTKILKVRPAEIPPTKSAISFRLPDTTIARFKMYLRAYGALYGMDPDKDFITNEIFMDFFNSDKQFLAYLKENPVELVTCKE
jgi:hypothetical protein